MRTGPADELWDEHAGRVLARRLQDRHAGRVLANQRETIAAELAALGSFRLRYTEVVATDAAMIAVAWPAGQVNRVRCSRRSAPTCWTASSSADRSGEAAGMTCDIQGSRRLPNSSICRG